MNTFLNGPQGSNTSGTIGYKGWFYHFLDMNTASRSPNSELSSIDTTLLLAGILYAKQYFDGTNSDETTIRTMADAIVNRVDWNWMARGTNVVSMGWFPPGSFIANNWVGYNEGMILYALGLGAATNPLPASAWNRWTAGYTWATNYGQAYVPFPPLFGHQYSHCWIDFRHIADPYMNGHESTYFENSRRASLAQRAYCIANPLGRVGYSSNVDQGPIVIMIENYRNQRVWRLFMRNEEVQRGLQRAGFVPLASVSPGLLGPSEQNTFTLTWDALAGRTYQVEYSSDLSTWFASPTGQLIAGSPTASWTDSGLPATATMPFTVPQRFYRVFQLGYP